MTTFRERQAAMKNNYRINDLRVDYRKRFRKFSAKLILSENRLCLTVCTIIARQTCCAIWFKDHGKYFTIYSLNTRLLVACIRPIYTGSRGAKQRMSLIF